jgi:hypothetical protein
MDAIYTELQEKGLDSYYSKTQENIIKTIVDNYLSCH